MLISHRYKFIFIKTMKTAGTSTEIALSKYLGPRDIITPICWEDEKLRRNLGYRGPQNFLLPLRHLAPANWQRWRRPYFYNHISAGEVRNLIDPEIWNSYFKFCVERNPWDKVISWYYWSHKKSPRPSLTNFIHTEKLPELARRGSSNLWTIDGDVAVNHIYQYEELDQAMADLAGRVDLPEVPQLPRAKGRFRKNRAPYQTVYGDLERKLVADTFAREISLLDYSF